MALALLLARIIAIALAVLVPGWLLARAITGRTDSATLKRLAPVLGGVMVPAVALALGFVLRMPWRWPLLALAALVVTLLAMLLLKRRR